MNVNARINPASYRDPAGFVFTHEKKIYRQVNKVYAEEWQQFINSGLYRNLESTGKIIAHTELKENLTGTAEWHTTIRPDHIPLISYPYEWSFDMLKDAALLTLDIMRTAMEHDMILKDASAYNVQWCKGKMIFIDTLSFGLYDPKNPWIAYRQFCEHFLAPLAVMHYTQQPLHPLLQAYPEGLPLAIASKLLPWRSRFNMHIYLHLHLHARVSNQKNNTAKAVDFSKQKLLNIISSLQAAVTNLKLNTLTTWSHYYEEAERRDDYLAVKKQIISDWIRNLDINTAFDAGANDGNFSKLLAEQNIITIAADGDHFAINRLYLEARQNKDSRVQPLLIDFANPSPGLGLNNIERSNLFERVNADLVMGLAFIHHLSIARNIPFEAIAHLFTQLGKTLIIEFVPKSDPKVQEMLKSKQDIYDWYTEENFQAVFSQYYHIEKSAEISNSGRILYLMQPL